MTLLPADARVLFSVELLNYQEIPEKLEIFDMTAEERAELPFSEVYKAAESLKMEAKTDWEREDYQDAAIKLATIFVLLLKKCYELVCNHISSKLQVLKGCQNAGRVLWY